MRIDRALLGVFVVGVTASPAAILAGACGGEPVTADGGLGPEAAGADGDSSWDAPDATDTATDAGSKWWTGCPNIPVVCPDADYYITINGDGPAQILRSNQTPPPRSLWYADAEYHIPLADFYPPGGGGNGFLLVNATDTPDASGAPGEIGTIIAIATDPPNVHRALGYSHNGKGYSSQAADAQPDVVYTQVDPPGGFVVGSYSTFVANMYAPGTGILSLSGKFFACRICDTPPIQ